MLRQVEMQTAQGRSIAVAFKEADLSEQNYYRWRKKYGFIQIDQVRRLKYLERENTQLLWFIADLSLKKQVLVDVASGNL